VRRGWIWSLDFSPDGRLLASSGLDYTALVWDVTGLCPDGRWPPREARPPEVERLWADLAGDAVRAYRAVWAFAAAPRQSVLFLASRLRPAAAVDAGRVAGLIADLDNDQIQVRSRAAEDLQKLGELAVPALRRALGKQPSLEARRRLETLLQRAESRALTAEQLRTVRAVEILEHIGSAAARAVLQALAGGAERARLTEEAKAAVERLTRRPAAGR
jgi:hypothetical protein